jgi:anti-sigma factor ChrR (cupin superfamily)
LNSDQKSEEIQAMAALYALGALTQNEAHAFEAHLTEETDLIVEELVSFESVVASLGLCAPEASPSGSLRERLTTRIASQSAAGSKPFRPEFTQTKFFSLRADEGEWKEIARGVLIKILFADREKETVTMLLKLQPGARILRHSHPGFEQCLILAGDFWANGQRLGPGDFHVAPPGSVHDEITSHQGSIALIIAPEHYETLNAES